MRAFRQVVVAAVLTMSCASWAQLVFPYGASYSGSGPMWSLTNTGSGATVNYVNNSSTTPTMTVWNNSTSRAIAASSEGTVGEFFYGGGNGFILVGTPASSGTGVDVMQQCLPPLVGPCLGGFYKAFGDFSAVGLKANSGIAVQGIGFASLASVGVEGQGGTAIKAVASPTSGVGVLAQTQSGTAVMASSTTGTALSASASSGGIGILANATSQNAVQAFSSAGAASAIYAGTLNSNTGNAITGVSGSRNGIEGRTSAVFASGVYGENTAMGYGVAGRSSGSGTAVLGDNTGSGYAGYFYGRVHVNGTLSKLAGSFRIDHPVDPANKYLVHSFVESPDMLNVYSGVVAVGSNGEAWVKLPDYWSALNVDPRYQLTAIGSPGNLYIKREYSSSDNMFLIGGAAPGSKVSWQLTGVRNDPYAQANRIQPEVAKAASERGKFLTPELYGRSKADRIGGQPFAASEENPVPVVDPVQQHQLAVERARQTDTPR